MLLVPSVYATSNTFRVPPLDRGFFLHRCRKQRYKKNGCAVLSAAYFKELDFELARSTLSGFRSPYSNLERKMRYPHGL